MVIASLSAVSTPALKPGKQVGPFRIEKLLGVGGMGEVYQALDPRLSRQVALKRLRLQCAMKPDLRSRFHREARAVAQLCHPAIVQIFDIMELRDEELGLSAELSVAGDWLVMELASGCCLNDWVAQGPVSYGLALSVAIEICSGLMAAHEIGLIHRDLKSDNVIVTEAGKPKILDFGLVKHDLPAESQKGWPSAREGTAVTRIGQLIGTPRCMSPELIRGTGVDHRCDLFSLGVLIYELTTGQSPFAARTPLEAVSKVCKLEPPPPSAIAPSLPPGLDALVGRCLEKLPEDRYASAEQVLRDLQALATKLSVDQALGGASSPGIVPIFLPVPSDSSEALDEDYLGNGKGFWARSVASLRSALKKQPILKK